MAAPLHPRNLAFRWRPAAEVWRSPLSDGPRTLPVSDRLRRAGLAPPLRRLWPILCAEDVPRAIAGVNGAPGPGGMAVPHGMFGTSGLDRIAGPSSAS